MWVFTKRGFLSIVTSENAPQFFLVRSRFPGHIEELFPHETVAETHNIDYRFHAAVPKQLVKQVLAELVMDVDYANFKKVLPDSPYRDACLDVWSALLRYQEGTAGP